MSGTPMEEQETTVCAGRAEEHVVIYTTNTVHLRKLRADERVAEVQGGEDWGEFKIPSEHWDPLGGVKRRRKPMTEEQRSKAADNLAAARAKRSNGNGG